MITRLCALAVLIIIIFDISYGQLVKIITLDRDRRCNGQIVFQKKPADSHDFGNFLNSTSFSEMDCAVKCYQRVPYCRAVRYDHVSNNCMYSSKDHGTCFRTPPDDPSSLQSARMLTMYCIQCIDRNVTWIPGTRKIVPIIPLTQPLPVPNIVSQEKPSDLQNIIPVSTNASKQNSAPVLPIPAPVQSQPQVLPLAPRSEASLQSNRLLPNAGPPSSQIPSAGFAPAAPAASQAGQFPFDLNSTYDKEYDSNEVISLNSSNFVDAFQSPVSLNVGDSPKIQPLENQLNPRIPIDNNIFPVPALFSADSNSSVLTRQRPLQRKTNALFPGEENVGDIFASPQSANGPNIEEYQNSTNNSFVPLEPIPPPASAQVLHTFNESSGTFSNNEPIELNFTVFNQTSINIFNAINETALPQIPFLSVTPLFVPEKKPIDQAIPVIRPEQSSGVNQLVKPPPQTPPPALLPPSPPQLQQTQPPPLPSIPPQQQQQTPPTTSIPAPLLSSLSPLPPQQPQPTPLLPLQQQQQTQPPPLPPSPLSPTQPQQSQSQQPQQQVQQPPPPSPPQQQLPQTQEPQPQQQAQSPLPQPQQQPQPQPSVSQTSPPPSPQQQQQTQPQLPQQPPLPPQTQSGSISGQLNPINLASTVVDPSCREEDLLPCSNHIGRECIVVKPEKCPLCFCPYRSPAKGCSGPNGLNEIVRNELIQGKRLCPNGQPATTVFRYARKIDKEKKFDNCVRTIQPWCGSEQDLSWQMPRFVNDCYYYCYKDKELRERNFFNITTYD